MSIGLGNDITIGSRLGVRLTGAGGWTPVFLLRDDFTTTEAAPLASPRTCEPGGGTLTLVQTDGEFSIANGKLVFPAQTTAAWGDQGFYGAAVARAAGVALIQSVAWSAFGTNQQWFWSNAAAIGLANRVHGMGGNLGITASRGFVPGDVGSGIALATSTTYHVAMVLRNTGCLHFIKGGAFTNWTLEWVTSTSTTTPLYPALSNYDAAGTLSTLRVLDLPAPFSTDHGLATNRIAGAVSVGATFVHEADCLIEWTQTTLPSTNATRMQLRKQDANNFWRIVCEPTGYLGLQEVVAGIPTIRGAAPGVLANGHRIVVIADGTTIRVYSNNVLRITYASATNFATATSGELELLSTGGAVSDIVAWPRTLSGQAKTLLDAAIDA